MQIEDAILQLGRKMGLDLRLDANRACRLVFDGTMAVDFEAPAALPDHLVMSCVVGSDLFPKGRLAVLQSLLEANLFGRGSGGGQLALDEERGEFLLQRVLDVSHASLQDLVSALAQLLTQAEVWVQRLKAGPSHSPQAPMGPSNVMASALRI